MRISVFGLGYVGSVTAACFAKLGHEVQAVDSMDEKVSAIAAGRSPVLEPGLAELIEAQVRLGRLRATSSAKEALAGSELALICVGTPGRGRGQQDLAALERVRDDLLAALRGRTGAFTLVLRSTVLPGTAESLFEPLVEELGGQLDVRVAVNPEFMREGCALRDFANPPMIVIGCESAAGTAHLRALYAGVEGRVVETGLRNAEMVKFICNTFHALKICFANEVEQVSEALGADGREVMRIFALDEKLNCSAAYLRPGFAFGGSCLPKDVRALSHAARAADLVTPILASILPSNEQQLALGIEKVLAADKRRVGVVGLAFKPGSDDVRESPYLTLIERLIGQGCDVRIYDRHVSLAGLVGANRLQLRQRLPHIESLLCRSVRALVSHAEVLVIAHRGEDAEQALREARPEQRVVDLTQELPRFAALELVQADAR